jgi:DNA-binding NtrC family response regulator
MWPQDILHCRENNGQKAVEPICKPNVELLVKKLLRLLVVTNMKEFVAFGQEFNTWRIFTDNPESIDLVITDKTMPELSGLTLAEKIRSVRTDLPIILCSGDQTGIIPTMLGTVGIQNFPVKPFILGDLTRVAQEALLQKESSPSSLNNLKPRESR